jgi:spore maturation protein CgeB
LSELTQEKADGIGRAALKRVLSEHTYDHRAVLLEAVLLGKVQTPAVAQRAKGAALA